MRPLLCEFAGTTIFSAWAGLLQCYIDGAKVLWRSKFVLVSVSVVEYLLRGVCVYLSLPNKQQQRQI